MRNKAEIKAIFLDIDNTLLDFDESVRESMKYGFQKYQLRPYEDWMFSVFLEENHRLWCQLEQGELTYEGLMKVRWNRIFERLKVTFDGERFERFFVEYLFDSAIPAEGAADFLKRIHKSYILCAASNGPYEQQINRLKKTGLLSDFDHLFISERMGASKPSRLFFERAIEELNQSRRLAGKEEILPQEILMVGDSPSSDMRGGIDSGLKTCLMDWRGNGPLPGQRIDHTVVSLKELAEFLLEKADGTNREMLKEKC